MHRDFIDEGVSLYRDDVGRLDRALCDSVGTGDVRIGRVSGTDSIIRRCPVSL